MALLSPPNFSESTVAHIERLSVCLFKMACASSFVNIARAMCVDREHLRLSFVCERVKSLWTRENLALYSLEACSTICCVLKAGEIGARSISGQWIGGQCCQAKRSFVMHKLVLHFARWPTALVGARPIWRALQRRYCVAPAETEVRNRGEREFIDSARA